MTIWNMNPNTRRSTAHLTKDNDLWKLWVPTSGLLTLPFTSAWATERRSVGMAYYSCNVDINDMFANIEQNSIMMSCFVAKLICDTFLCNMYVYLLRVFDKIFIVLLKEMYLNTPKDEMDITGMRKSDLMRVAPTWTLWSTQRRHWAQRSRLSSQPAR